MNKTHYPYISKKKTLTIIFFIYIMSLLFAEPIIIDTINKDNINYFSIHDFIHKNNLRSTYYESKEKLEIIYEGNKLYFSPYSSFCRINDSVYHFTYPSLLINNNLYIPVLSSKEILKESNLSIEIETINKNNISIEMNTYDIQDFYIEKKENGIEISLQTTKLFSEKNHHLFHWQMD